jgi:hypothetical protein
MQNCLDGQYQPSIGEGYCIPCDKGLVCQFIGGTLQKNACPTNSYCPAVEDTLDGLAFGRKLWGLLCEPGTYTTSTGLEAADDCSPASTGTYVVDGGKMAGTASCIAGFYCESGADRPDPPDMPCPAGYYCTDGSLAPSLCPTGKFRGEVFNKELNI